MPCEVQPPTEDRGSAIAPGIYILHPEDMRTNEYSRVTMARDVRLTLLTKAIVSDLAALVGASLK